MARRDDAGELLEGDGIEDTVIDGGGDNTGDAGDRYRGSVRFGLAQLVAGGDGSLSRDLHVIELPRSPRTG